MLDWCIRLYISLPIPIHTWMMAHFLIFKNSFRMEEKNCPLHITLMVNSYDQIAKKFVTAEFWKEIIEDSVFNRMQFIAISSKLYHMLWETTILSQVTHIGQLPCPNLPSISCGKWGDLHFVNHRWVRPCLHFHALH